MSILKFPVIFLFAVSCNSKKPTENIATEKKDSTTTTVIPSTNQDSMNIAIGSMESIGDLSLGLDHTGPPTPPTNNLPRHVPSNII